MIEARNKPLLTFALLSYGQEQFIKEAVQGALAQTYEPLQIILSDDCSPDGTFRIMEELVRAYKGPHRITLNRNPVNLGLGGHVNKAMALVEGEFVVIAAGDDVSLPQRTTSIYEAWESSGRKAYSIFSSYTSIDSRGQVIREAPHPDGIAEHEGHFQLLKVALNDYINQKAPGIWGFSHAFSPDWFRRLGPLPPKMVNEDMVIGFRSLLLGQWGYITKPLVRYRRHDNNLSSGEFARDMAAQIVDLQSLRLTEAKIVKSYRRREDAYDSYLLDVKRAVELDLVSAARGNDLQRRINKVQQGFRLRRELVGSSGFTAARLLLKLLATGISRKVVLSNFPRVLPRSAFESLQLRKAQRRSQM